MGFFRFRSSIRIAPGLRLNLGKRSASVSAGVRGAHVTVGEKGTRTTVGISGTGLSYIEVPPNHPREPESASTPEVDDESPSRPGLPGWAWALLLIGLVACLAAVIGR